MEDAGAERQALLGEAHSKTLRQYESIEQVAVRLDWADRPGSTSHPGEGRESDSEDEPPKTINIDESAPTSYVCLGYIFSIIAGLCFTSCNIGIKFAGLHIAVSSWQMLFVRCLGQSLGMVPLVLWSRSSILASPDFSTRWRITAQAVVGGLMLLSIFEAVKRLPIGDCTAIFFSTPAVTLLLSTVLLKEHYGVYRLLIGTCLVIGVVIISRPPALFPAPISAPDNSTATNATHSAVSGLRHIAEVKQPYDLVGLAFAVAMPFLSAWVAIITRELRAVHFSVLVFWFAIGGLLVSIIGILFLDSEPLFFEWTWVTWLLSIQQAVLGIVGSVLMTKAVCWMTPAKTMVIRSFQVIISYIIQVEFFGTLPHTSDYFGACLIMTAVFTIGAEDKMMKTFSFYKYC